MDNTRIEELLAVEKKDAASKAIKDEYAQLMVGLLKEEGITEKTAEYIRRGFSFCGAYPYAVYLSELDQEDRLPGLRKILDSEDTKNAQVPYPIRLGLNLFAQLLSVIPEAYELYGELIKEIPTKKLSKDKKPIKELNKIISKQFLYLIDKGTVMPDLEKIDIKEVFKADFAELIISCIESGEATKLVYSIKSKVLDWLKIKEQIARKPEASGAENAEMLISRDEKSLSKELTAKDIIDFQNFVKQFIPKLTNTINSNKKQTAEDDKEKKTLEAAIKRQKDSIEELKIKIDELEKTANYYKNNSELLLTERNSYREEAEILKQKLCAESEENARLESLVEGIQNGNSREITETLNRIASKLKSDYDDFKLVENDEITLELGKAFHYQIKSIFKILEKNGIKVGER